MKLLTIEKIYNSIKNEVFEINLAEDIISKAQKPIMRMIEISKKLGI
jgi:quinolinate synthase